MAAAPEAPEPGVEEIVEEKTWCCRLGWFPSQEPLVISQESENEMRPQTKRRSWKKRLATVSVLVMANVVCIILFVATSMQPARLPAVGAGEASEAPVTALQLFQGRELAEVATDNLMSLGRDQLSFEDRDKVRAHVAAGFRNVSAMLARRFPGALVELNSIVLSPKQKGEVLAAMRGLGDSRVQGLGREVAERAHGAMRDSRGKEDGSGALRRRLQEFLEPRLPAIQHLREEFVPRARGRAGSGGGTLHLDRLRLAQHFNKWRLQVDVEGVEAPLVSSPARRLSGMADVLMVGVNMLTHASEFFQHVQSVASDVIGDRLPDMIAAFKKMDMGDLMSCAMNSVVSARFVGAIQCGVEFASEGMDVLSAGMGDDEPQPAEAR